MHVDAAPARGCLRDADGFPRSDPGARKPFAKVDALFVGIFQNEHPADKERNGELRGDAENRAAAIDAGDLSGNPSPASVIVIAVRVEEEKVFLYAIKAQ